MNAFVTEARAWIGTPYVHQASTKGAGADCLGLIRGLWRAEFGAEPIKLAPYTADWNEASHQEALWEGARAVLTPKAVADMALGDVLLFRMRVGCVAKHLGLVSTLAPAPRFIHAYSGHGVVETTLSQPWRARVVACFEFPKRGA